MKDQQKLPLIVPFVIYAGKNKYNAPRNLWQLFALPEHAKKLFTENYELIDLESMSDDQITRKKHLGLFEYVLKHIHQRDMLKLWEDLFKKLPHAIVIDKEQDYFYIKKILWYIEAKVPEERQEELNKLILNNLSEEEGKEIMRSIAQKYVDEGIELGKSQGIELGKSQGIELGEAKLIKMMLNKGNSVETISKITGLPIKEIQKLSSYKIEYKSK